MKKDVLELKKGMTGTGGTYDEIEFDRVPPGQVWCVQSATFIDRTSLCTKLQVYKRTGNEDEELEEHTYPRAAFPYWLNNMYYLREGQRIVARWTGTASADKLYGWIRGYRTEDK